LINYFKQTIENKENLITGNPAPTFVLKNSDNQDITLSSLQGKPVCIAFCFNLKQHELIFKPLEQKYGARMTFVYLNITPNTDFALWKSTVEPRPNVMHLWASEEANQQLRNSYLSTMRYPFVLIDAQGKLVERWIPQAFPDNPALKTELKALMAN